MTEIDELRRELGGEPVTDFFAKAQLHGRLFEFVRSGPRDEVISLLDLVDRPLALTDDELGSPKAMLVIAVVNRFPDSGLVPLLEQAEVVSPARVRPALVRSMLQIAVKTGNEQVFTAAVGMLHRLVRDEVPIVGFDTPLYWLEVHPSFPERIGLELARLAAYTPLTGDVERVRAAYAATFPHMAEAFGRSSVRFADLQHWADTTDERLVHAVTDHVAAVDWAAGALGYEAVVALPQPLVATYAVHGVEAEVLNGGYNQYFWNAAGRFADEAVEAFEALDAADYATVQRSAIRTYIDHAHDLRRYRDEGTTEAFSASCKLKVFDDVDEAFTGIYERVAVTDILTAWLRPRLRQVADAIGVTD